jgi:hypothetical protein
MSKLPDALDATPDTVPVTFRLVRLNTDCGIDVAMTLPLIVARALSSHFNSHKPDDGKVTVSVVVVSGAWMMRQPPAGAAANAAA